MSSRWLKRRTRLRELLTISVQDEDEEALAIDRVLHGQSVIGKTGICFQQSQYYRLLIFVPSENNRGRQAEIFRKGSDAYWYPRAGLFWRGMLPNFPFPFLMCIDT